MCACTVWCNLKHICRFIYTYCRLVFDALDQRCDGRCGLPDAVLTIEFVRLVSCLPKRLVGLFVNTMIKYLILSCARELRERLTHLQGEELTCPTEDDEPSMKLSSDLSMKPSTSMLMNLSIKLVTNLLKNKSISKMMSNLNKVCMLLKSC